MAACATCSAASLVQSWNRSARQNRSQQSHLEKSSEAFCLSTLSNPVAALRSEQPSHNLHSPGTSSRQGIQSSNGGALHPLRDQALREHRSAGHSLRTLDPLQALGGGGGGSSGDGFDKVQQLLGQALREDRKAGFGPPPPKDREGGSGFVNLVGIEDLLAGQRDFNVAASRSASASSDAEQRSPTTNDGESESASLPVDAGRELPSPSPSEPGSRGVLPLRQASAAASGTPAAAPTQQQPTVKVPVKPLPEVKLEQKVIAAGLLALTLVAFARGSEEILPGSVLEFLQAWMLLAWAGHFLLGCVAAWLATRQGWSGPYWFFKVLFCGAVAFEKDLWEEIVNGVLGRPPKDKP